MVTVQQENRVKRAILSRMLIFVADMVPRRSEMNSLL